jgi:hypothetical protein
VGGRMKARHPNIRMVITTRPRIEASISRRDGDASAARQVRVRWWIRVAL